MLAVAGDEETVVRCEEGFEGGETMLRAGEYVGGVVDAAGAGGRSEVGVCGLFEGFELGTKVKVGGGAGSYVLVG